MEIELQRIHDKINYETNVVDPKTFAILLEAVRKNQPLMYVNGRDNVFPQARSTAGMQWDATKPDTHASNTLEQYGLVNATEDRTISVSDLGYKFLKCFDSNFSIVANNDYYKTVLLQMIFAWVELEHGRNIHPGRMLFKLMMDSELGNYSTNHEFALWTSDAASMSDRDYAKIKELVLNYRANPYDIQQKKAEVFLRPFANSWGLFDREISGNTYTFTIREDVLPLVDQFFISSETEASYHIIESKLNENSRVKNGINVLLYGVPGSGKSWTIEKQYCNDENRMERLVFHPDYTYSDFIGQILPNVSDGIVNYVFTEGPFTSLLKKAYNHPDKMFFLVIEEINRGNAPAIFGEVFQLLDRNDEGTSEYGITNVDIARIVYGNPDKKVRIPSNMSIIGTMNTSDQNVFTLDTAFQRRWNMRMIENTFEGHNYARTTILDTDVTWQRFCEVINNEIVTKNILMTSSEDKRLGAYFISAADLEYHEAADNNSLSETEQIQARLLNYRFGEKVLKYLWDDAFKFSRDDIFKNTIYKSLEEVVDHFNSRSSAKAIGNDRFDVFKEEIIDAFITQNSIDSSVK